MDAKDNKPENKYIYAEKFKINDSYYDTENKLIYYPYSKLALKKYKQKKEDSIISNTMLCGLSFLCFKEFKHPYFRLASLGVSVIAAFDVLYNILKY